MNRAASIPPIGRDDRLPHDQAVWREGVPFGQTNGQQISVDYGAGQIEQTTVGDASWERVLRWRWGWAPQ